RDFHVTGVQTCALPILITEIDGNKISKDQAQQLISNGKYQIAFLVPKGLSESIDKKVQNNVGNILAEFGFETDSALESPFNAQRSEERRVGKECSTR